MKMVTLGQAGLKVPAVGLGCMGMSDFYGGGEEAANLSVLAKAAELGCRFWDTSDMYGPFTNEELLGKALKGRRDQIILATKFGVDRSGGGWALQGSPQYVKACCEASLQRLKIDCIDLYYQHRADPKVPIEDTVGAMAELVKEGKVRYLGLSEASSELLERANQVHPISALQTEYSLWTRDVEDEILPTVRRLGIGYVAYSPLGRGFLTGAIQKRSDLEANDWRLTNPRFTEEAIEKNRQLVASIASLAQEKGVTPAQLALAWVLSKGDDLAAIPGTRQEKYLLQNWQAQDIQLTPPELQKLDQLSGEFKVMGARY